MQQCLNAPWFHWHWATIIICASLVCLKVPDPLCNEIALPDHVHKISNNGIFSVATTQTSLGAGVKWVSS